MIYDQSQNTENHSRQREQEKAEDKWAEEGLRERLRFEQLLFDLSARFVNIAPDQVDLEIENALRQILEFFQVDRFGLVRVSPHDNSFRITHIAYASDIPPVPENSDLSINLFPWVHEKIIKQHEVVSFTTRDELPSAAAVDRQTYEELSVRSALNIPISVGATFDYIFSINVVRNEYAWPEDYLPRLRLMGVSVDISERKQMEDQLEKRLREIEGLKQQLEKENIHLREEIELQLYPWPGNAWELRNVVEHAMIVSSPLEALFKKT